MRFLADMGVSMATVRSLRERGHEVVHLRDVGLERLSDEFILARAAADAEVVLTFDLDFGDLLAAGRQHLPSVVIFRLHDARPPGVTARLLEVIGARAAELAAGAIVTVEDARYRLRRLPILP